MVMVAATAVLTACVAPTSSTENVGEAMEAVSSAGLTASVTTTSNGSSAVKITIKLTNNSPNPASNWQVAVNLNQSVFAGGVTGQVELNEIGGLQVISPNNHAGTLAPGASISFWFPVSATGSKWTPTIAWVNGVGNGSSGAGLAADGVDHIARGAATAALNVAAAYANDKLPNDGDSMYDDYDGFIWAAQAYAISGNQIIFDPNVPGYKYIPNQAKAELAFSQLDPGVASYLVDGLQSCFNNTDSQLIYNFRPGVLKGYASNTTTTGTLSGLIAEYGAPSGYNRASAVDKYSTVGLGHGGKTVSSTLTSTTAHPDYYFGLLVAISLTNFADTAAVVKKYYSTQGDGAACSPFNGPGGSANPYFVVSLNNQAISPRFDGAGQACASVCTSQIVIDPVAYATPGAYYDSSGNLVGPQVNPFTLDQAQLYAVANHQSQWAMRVSNGVETWGTFSTPVTLFGVTKYAYTDQSSQ
jgi:hypothetical protein